MEAFATRAQLAAYLGVAEAALPADADRLLDRASELIDAVSLGRYRPATAIDEVRDRVAKATCAQVEAWIKGADGEQVDISGGYRSYSTGTVMVTREKGSAGAGSSDASRLAPRARTNLFRAGLLNSAVRIRATVGFSETDDDD